MKGSSVEVKIGVTDSPRELNFNSAQTPTEVEKLITDALAKDSGVLALTDEKGRRFLVQAAKIAYVEIGAADIRRVGFGVGVVGAEAVKNG
jgi:pyruvate/2-oxoglutarate/acetoin dehydrogenase E1 component